MAKKKSAPKKKAVSSKSTLTKKKSSSSETSKKMIPRKHLRFIPDPGAMAYILTNHQGVSLKTPLPCLVIEESYGGCSLVAVKDILFEKDTEFTVQVGKLPAMKARVRWSRLYDGKVSYFGIEYQV